MEKEKIKTDSWLHGCQICNEGLASAMDKLIEKNGISEKKASEYVSQSLEQRLGTELYTPDAIRKRYRRERGKNDGAGQNVQKQNRTELRKKFTAKNGKTLYGWLREYLKEIKRAIEFKALTSSEAKEIYEFTYEVTRVLKPLVYPDR